MLFRSIRYYRERNGLTQKAMGELMGKTENWAHKAEKGLELKSKRGLEPSPADDRAAEGEERLVDVGADLPADA